MISATRLTRTSKTCSIERDDRINLSICSNVVKVSNCRPSRRAMSFIASPSSLNSSPPFNSNRVAKFRSAIRCVPTTKRSRGSKTRRICCADNNRTVIKLKRTACWNTSLNADKDSSAISSGWLTTIVHGVALNRDGKNKSQCVANCGLPSSSQETLPLDVWAMESSSAPRAFAGSDVVQNTGFVDSRPRTHSSIPYGSRSVVPHRWSSSTRPTMTLSPMCFANRTS